jgi:transposase
MSSERRAYPSDVTDEEWVLVAPSLTLLPEGAGQREHALREVFNGLRYIVKTGAPWRWMPNDLPPWAEAAKVPPVQLVESSRRGRCTNRRSAG